MPSNHTFKMVKLYRHLYVPVVCAFSLLVGCNAVTSAPSLDARLDIMVTDPERFNSAIQHLLNSGDLGRENTLSSIVGTHIKYTVSTMRGGAEYRQYAIDSTSSELRSADIVLEGVDSSRDEQLQVRFAHVMVRNFQAIGCLKIADIFKQQNRARWTLSVGLDTGSYEVNSHSTKHKIGIVIGPDPKTGCVRNVAILQLR